MWIQFEELEARLEGGGIRAEPFSAPEGGACFLITSLNQARLILSLKSRGWITLGERNVNFSLGLIRAPPAGHEDLCRFEKACQSN